MCKIKNHRLKLRINKLHFWQYEERVSGNTKLGITLNYLEDYYRTTIYICYNKRIYKFIMIKFRIQVTWIPIQAYCLHQQKLERKRKSKGRTKKGITQRKGTVIAFHKMLRENSTITWRDRWKLKKISSYKWQFFLLRAVID